MRASVQFSSIQSLSSVWLFMTPWTAARQVSLSITNSRSLLKLMSIISSWSYSNSCPLSRWCHPTISSSFVLFSSHLQSFPASGSFPMSWFFTSGGQSIRASASVLPVNIQDWFPSGWTSWISLLSKGLSRVFSNTTAQKHQFFGAQLSLWSGYHLWRQRHEQWKIDHWIKDPTSRWNPHLSPGWPQSVPLPPLQSIIPSYLLPEPQFHSLQGLLYKIPHLEWPLVTQHPLYVSKLCRTAIFWSVSEKTQWSISLF